MEAQTAPKKILLVEDDTALAKILVNKLNNEGFITYHAENGQEGLNRALQEKPDLVLLDLLLPIMTGLEMLKELRKDDWGKNAKVIIITNLTDDENLHEALNYGVYEYLVKANWMLDDVIEKVKHSVGAEQLA